MKVNNLTMETCKFFAVLLLYCVCSVYCYPARPLNERSPELTWQAWLLVDDQNQNKQHTQSDGTLRRRITPKSVFIAPTFSPESLPPCADGYSSDTMGRCIKIIKLDQDAHRDFIIQKLKERFGPIDYGDEMEDEVVPTTGPFQINIPLNVDDEESEEDTDVAIIVSPTKTFMANGGISLDKRDSIDDENKQEVFLKKLAETTTKKSEETTTVTEQSTTLDNEASTLPEDLTLATEAVTVLDDGFVAVTETRAVKRSTTEEGDTTLDATEEYPEFTTESPSMTTKAAPKIKTAVPSGFRFPDESDSETLVKFPDTFTFQTQIPSSVEVKDTSRYLNDQAVYKLSDTPARDRRVVFRDQPHVEIANLDYTNGVQRQLSSTDLSRDYNRRNRDRHSMFLLPPRWSQMDRDRPFVLRFSRKHAYVDESRFKNPDYYRSVPSDDLAFLFKFKHKQLNHR